MLKRIGLTAFSFSLLIFGSGFAAYAQSITGQVSGSVTDPTGGSVVNASVQLTHDDSRQSRVFTTSEAGTFIFTGLVPGAYSLRIGAAGFKTYEQKSFSVGTAERVDMHEITLSVGDVNSTVEVQANAVHVQTDSSDRSIAIGLRQIEDTPTRGRNPLCADHDVAGRADAGFERFRGWSGGGIPGCQWRPDGPDHPQSGRRFEPGFRQPESRLPRPPASMRSAK